VPLFLHCVSAAAVCCLPGPRSRAPAPLQDEELKGVKRLISGAHAGGHRGGGGDAPGLPVPARALHRAGPPGDHVGGAAALRVHPDLELRPDLLQHPGVARRRSDQSVELSRRAPVPGAPLRRRGRRPRRGGFRWRDGSPSFPRPLQPLSLPPYSTCAFETPDGRVTVQSYLARWSLLALLDPLLALEHLLYLGYPLEEAVGGLQVTRRRRADRKAGVSQRRVVLCNVLGPPGAGKSSLLDALCGRPFQASGEGQPGRPRGGSDRRGADAGGGGGGCAGGGWRGAGAAEWGEQRGRGGVGVQGWRTCWGRRCWCCGSSRRGQCQLRWTRLTAWRGLTWRWWCTTARPRHHGRRGWRCWNGLAARAEAQGNEAPCILVAAKDDLGAESKVFPHSARVCAEMGVRAPIPVSARIGDTPQLWAQVLQAAARPHLGVPETSASRAQRRRALPLPHHRGCQYCRGCGRHRGVPHSRRRSSQQ